MKQPHIVVVGSLNMDIVVEASRPPIVGETLLGQSSHFIPGGKGANQAVAAARLGARTSMIGAVGDDSFGDELRKSLQNNGVDAAAIKTVQGVSTGIASILLAQGDNQIIVVPGANAFCSPDDILLHEGLIAQADIVVVQLEIPLETVEAAAAIAKKHGKTVILNPAPAQALPDSLLRRSDYITPNRSELALLTGLNTDEAKWEEAMKRLLEKGPNRVIVTLGSEGSAYMMQGADLSFVPAYRVAAVDTTGAGDAYNGGLAYALGIGNEVADAIRFATKVSALSVTKLGAQAGMPTLEEVEALEI